MCQLLGIELELSRPRAIYEHEWGMRSDRAKKIRYNCYITIFDTNVLSTTIPIDLDE